MGDDSDTSSVGSYQDLGGSSSDEEAVDSLHTKKRQGKPLRVITLENMCQYLFVDYQAHNYLQWKPMMEKYFPTGFRLRDLSFNPDWESFFDQIEEKPYYQKLQNTLRDLALRSGKIILPYGELVFNALHLLSPQDIRVVFIGQDPYINIEEIGGVSYPQATGLSFSLPMPVPLTGSLRNIFKNLLRFGHISKLPQNGCLAGWILQGCFLYNTSLTTYHRQSNAHLLYWKEFSKDLIKYISGKYQNLIFIAWGKDAHGICLNVDPKKHFIITSSHPSPYSFDKTMTGQDYHSGNYGITYPPFCNYDHFGKINENLLSHGKNPILWDLFFP